MGRNWFILAALVVVCASGAWVSPAWAGATGTTSVSIRPGDGSYHVGDRIAVEVWLEDVSDIYGADVQLSFDPTRLAVLDANASQAGVQVMPRADLLHPDFIVHQQADNTAGTIWYAATQLNPRLPVSGSGPLFSFSMEVLAPGATRVEVMDQMLSSRDGERIEAKPIGARYSIAGPDGIVQRVFSPLVMVSAH